MTTTILNIRPQTHIRSTQQDSVLFRIPEDKLSPQGLKRKKRLDRYNNYKRDLFDVALDAGFTIPDDYFHVIFFLPMPKTYRKKQRLELNMRAHKIMPDVDNLAKAMFDSLKKRDQTIHDVRIQKIWIEHPTGFIQIDHE